MNEKLTLKKGLPPKYPINSQLNCYYFVFDNGKDQFLLFYITVYTNLFLHGSQDVTMYANVMLNGTNWY